LQPDVDIRLVDTAHASRNEGILAKAIVDSDTSRQAGANNNKRTRGSSGNNIENPPPIHVVTKVWYTHLGYERTKRSVEESLKALQAVNTRQVYVHMLLHWPRCNDDIPWMNCDEEENNLPQYVKDVGPAPHLEIYACTVFIM
jgi:diketogulonate reductase-like aldo/keto reductase